MTLKRHVNQDSPTISRPFSISGQILSTVQLALTSASDMDENSPVSSDPACYLRGHVSWIQELLKVFFPPLNNIPNPGQQLSSPAEHSLD